VSASTVELASDVYPGDGPPIVILHGLLGAARNWMAIGKRLGADLETHVLDLRNHGRSPWIDGMTYGAIAADVARYIEERGLGAPTVIGHSMGGKAAMALALTTPERVGRLLVADIAPVVYDRVGRSSFLDYLDAMASLDLAPVDRRADADRALAEAIEDGGVRGFLLQNLVPGPNGAGFQWRCNLRALTEGMADILDFPEALRSRRYDGPTLFLTGAQSGYVKQEQRPQIRALFPAARFASLKDAGHWLHADQPRPFMDAVRAFVAAGNTA